MHRYDVIKHRHVIRDLSRAWRYLLVEASLAVAERFLNSVEKCIHDLASMPTLGTFYESDHPELQALRQWPVKGFKKYIIFYHVLETRHQIRIVRVLHGSRDLGTILKTDATESQ